MHHNQGVGNAALRQAFGKACTSRAGCGHTGNNFNFNTGRVSDILCMSNLVHASKLKEHEDNDNDYQ